MPKRTRLIKIAEGPITVTYRQVEDEWYCTVLEFDLVGTGATRSEALGSLQEIVSLYLIECLKEEGEFAFFNPSDREEWDNHDKERYEVSAILVRKKVDVPVSKALTLDEVRPLREGVRAFDFIPACV